MIRGDAIRLPSSFNYISTNGEAFLKIPFLYILVQLFGSYDTKRVLNSLNFNITILSTTQSR